MVSLSNNALCLASPLLPCLNPNHTYLWFYFEEVSESYH